MSRRPKTREMSLSTAIANWQAIPPELRACVLLRLSEEMGAAQKLAASSRAQVIPDFKAHADRMELAGDAYEAASAILQLATAYPVEADAEESR